MQFYEILIIIAIVLFVLSVFGVRIYKRVIHKPLDECACCHKSSKQLLKEYRKQYPKCCCKDK